ncbi:hypothetical protein DVH05_006133 [Phytophthora capsici]|nr:hypothetical protein DVH05_006133 [Phytophthora capsici]
MSIRGCDHRHAKRAIAFVLVPCGEASSATSGPNMAALMGYNDMWQRPSIESHVNAIVLQQHAESSGKTPDTLSRTLPSVSLTHLAVPMSI